MAHRGQESPMDFQYEGSAPTAPDSPFTRVSARGTPPGSGMAGPGGESRMDFQLSGPVPGGEAGPQRGGPAPGAPFARYSAARETPAKKRPLSIFQSPTPSRPPALTPPASQLFLFPKAPSQARPPPPVFRAASTALRRPAFDMSELSSDPDIFSTPAAPRIGAPGTPQAAPDAPDAPSTPRRGPRPVVFSAATAARITGRGEIPRGRYHDGAITKVRRRRQFRLPSVRAAGDGSDSGSGSGPDSDYGPPEHAPAPPSWKSSAAEWVSAHRDIPLIASQYLQLMFNLSLVLLLLYALFCFYLTIRHDVDKKVSEFSAAIQAEMNMCARSYVENRCAPDMRVPAMEAACSRWEKCMSRDSSQVGRARVSAETFAEIINSFIEPISYKTMFFCLLTVFGGIFFSNFAFGFYRAKALNHPAPYLAAAAPPIARRLEQMHPEEYQHVPSTPGPSTPVRGTPARSMGFRTKRGGRSEAEA